MRCVLSTRADLVFNSRVCGRETPTSRLAPINEKAGSNFCSLLTPSKDCDRQGGCKVACTEMSSHLTVDSMATLALLSLYCSCLSMSAHSTFINDKEGLLITVKPKLGKCVKTTFEETKKMKESCEWKIPARKRLNTAAATRGVFCVSSRERRQTFRS